VDALDSPAAVGRSSRLDLRRRRREPELMDDPELEASEHDAALRGLARINRFTAAARLTWEPIARLAREGAGPRRGDRAPAPLRVLDVATGAGDLPVALARLARSRSVPLELAGCDVSPRAVGRARLAAERAGERVEVFVHDVLRDPLPGGFDVVACSLFLHHLDDDDAVAVLERMAAAARRLVVAQDLVRSRAGLAWAVVGARALTRSRVVHVDAELSVRAAFTPDEAGALARRAGLEGARVRRRWPQRFVVEWRRP
jgi:SAM-dependent methyltransferase